MPLLSSNCFILYPVYEMGHEHSQPTSGRKRHMPTILIWARRVGHEGMLDSIPQVITTALPLLMPHAILENYRTIKT